MKPNPPMIQVLLHCNFVNLNYEDGTGDLAYLTFRQKSFHIQTKRDGQPKSS